MEQSALTPDELQRYARHLSLPEVGVEGQAKLNGYLEDYAYVVEGLLAVYEATFETRYFTAARELADTMIAQFWD